MSTLTWPTAMTPAGAVIQVGTGSSGASLGGGAVGVRVGAQQYLVDDLSMVTLTANAAGCFPLLDADGALPEADTPHSAKSLPKLVISPDANGELAIPDLATRGAKLRLKSLTGVAGAQGRVTPTLKLTPYNVAPSILTATAQSAAPLVKDSHGIKVAVASAQDGVVLGGFGDILSVGTYYISLSVGGASIPADHKVAMSLYNATKGLTIAYKFADATWTGGKVTLSVTASITSAKFASGDLVSLVVSHNGTAAAASYDFYIYDDLMMTTTAGKSYVPHHDEQMISLPLLYATDSYADGVLTINEATAGTGARAIPTISNVEYAAILSDDYKYSVVGLKSGQSCVFECFRTMGEYASVSNLQTDHIAAATGAYASHQDPVQTCVGWAYRFDKTYVGTATHADAYVCVNGSGSVTVAIYADNRTTVLAQATHAVTGDGWLRVKLPDALPAQFWVAFYGVESPMTATPPYTSGDDTTYPYGSSGAHYYILNYGTSKWWGAANGVWWPCIRFVYQAFADMQTLVDEVFTNSADPALVLPPYIDAVEGDTIELFRSGMVLAQDRYALGFDLIGAVGKNYGRRWTYTPAAGSAGSFDLRALMTDNAGNVLTEKTLPVTVRAPKSNPATAKTVLIVGDSLTENGVWPNEFFRRLKGTGGTPAGLGLTNYIDIGTITTAAAGPYHYEGRSGWAFTDYTSAHDGDNPFWDSELSRNSFTGYCTTNGYSGIDYCIILLGYNSLAAPETWVRTISTAFIDQLHTDYPSCKILLMGVHYPSYDGLAHKNASNSFWRGPNAEKMVSVTNAAYQHLAADADYSGFVRYGDIATQFDREYNFPKMSMKVNLRSNVMEDVQTDGVHPSAEGRLQIADAVYRAFMALA